MGLGHLDSERESEKANSSRMRILPILSVGEGSQTKTTNETNMDNVKLTLPNGTKLEAAYMSVAEAKELDGKPAVNQILLATLAEACGMLAMTNKIASIRLARAVMGTGLKEAKAFVDGHHAERVAQEKRWSVAQSAIDAESERLRRLDRDQREREDSEAARNGDLPF